MDVWRKGSVEGWMEKLVDEWMKGCIVGRMEGWANDWIKEWVEEQWSNV